MDNYVGKRLDGRYEIQEIIGVGGMSVVYKAYDNVDDRIVAVKILKDEFLTNDDFVRRFKNESKAIALLSHPNIVKVYDVSFGERLQYIVMEYVDGITLKEYIQKQGAITWNEALFFISQILKALQHAHDKGIVHRDVKPQNIILLADGSIKVADFGIARFSRSDTKTLTDTAIGSVHYISPEQAKGELTDEKSDIYSAGVVLYEMLAGKVPFEADSAVSVALMQLQNEAARLTQINADIPLGLEQICVHAMQKNPSDRYQTATEMLVDVEEIIINPAVTFDYSYFVDQDPTKYVSQIDNNADNGLADDEDYDDYDGYYDPNRKKKIITAVIIGVFVLIGAIVALVMSITGSIHTNASVLDNFVGQSYDELISTNTKYNFVMETEKTNDTAPGIIIRQSPEAGTKIIDGSQVTLVVSASMNDISLKNVYGLTREKAERAFEQDGLKNITYTTISSDTVEEGMIVYTDPKAGSVISSDTQITVFISSGPTTAVRETITVPDVVGLKQEGASAFLEKLGFTNVNFVIEDSMSPKGVVLAQSPAASSVASPDSLIKITISSGTTTTTTKESFRASIEVKLPTIAETSDTLIVELDGKAFSSSNVKLDGSVQTFSIPVDSGESILVRISLKNTGAVDTQTVEGKKNQKLTYDFTSFDEEVA